MSRSGSRRVQALRLMVLALLAGAKKALAGWLALIPWAMFNLVQVIIMGALVVVAMVVAVEGVWPKPDSSGGTEQDNRPNRPSKPGEGKASEPEPQPRSQRGSLEIRLDDNVDFRELRYTLSYRPGEPPVPGERLYLRSLRDGDGHVRMVDPADIQQHPARYGSLAAQPQTLCRRGYALSAGSPSCQGVLSMDPAYTRMRSTRVLVRAFAAELPALGPSGPQDAIGAVATSAWLRLAQVFFAVSSGPPDFRSRVSVAEQDPDNPHLFRLAGVSVDGQGQAAPQPVWRLDLSRDRGRLYLTGPGGLAMWRGSGALQTLYHADFGETLRDATPTDGGICVAYFREQQSGLRCLAQDHENWNPAQPFPRELSPVDLASVGRGVLVLGNEPGAPEQVRGYYVADASQFWLQFREAPVAAEGAEGLEGSLPMRHWFPGRDDYLLFGPYPNQRQGFWQLGMFESGAERSPSFFLVGPQAGDGQAPGGQHWVRSHEIWPDLAPDVARVFALSDQLHEIDYSLLTHRSLRTSTRELQLDAIRLDSMRLLEGEGRNKLLAVSGVRAVPPRSFVALLAYENAASPPQLLGLVDFSDPSQALRPMHRQVRVREISGNAMLLRPEV